VFAEYSFGLSLEVYPHYNIDVRHSVEEAESERPNIARSEMAGRKQKVADACATFEREGREPDITDTRSKT
jgi:hypothetical protein